MNHYIEIRLRPDPEFPGPVLMGALFSKLHRGLVTLGSGEVGISFPGYSLKPFGMGDTLRLHGTVEMLDRLMSQSWLSGMRDHTQVSAIQDVPAHASYCVVRRRQFKTNAERLRRRRARRHGESIEQAREHIPSTIERRVALPFLMTRSHSSAQRFCLFVEQSTPTATAVPGHFSAYGFSQGGATVPWF